MFIFTECKLFHLPISKCEGTENKIMRNIILYGIKYLLTGCTYWKIQKSSNIFTSTYFFHIIIIIFVNFYENRKNYINFS